MTNIKEATKRIEAHSVYEKEIFDSIFGKLTEQERVWLAQFLNNMIDEIVELRIKKMEIKNDVSS